MTTYWFVIMAGLSCTEPGRVRISLVNATSHSEAHDKEARNYRKRWGLSENAYIITKISKKCDTHDEAHAFYSRMTNHFDRKAAI